MPGDDGLRLDDPERRSPFGPDTRQDDPEPTVPLGEPSPPRAGALQHLHLVPQRQDFELKRGARMRPCSQGQQNRREHRHDCLAAYRSAGATSMAATRTDFSVGTTAFLVATGPATPPEMALRLLGRGVAWLDRGRHRRGGRQSAVRSCDRHRSQRDGGVGRPMLEPRQCVRGLAR